MPLTLEQRNVFEQIQTQFLNAANLDPSSMMSLTKELALLSQILNEGIGSSGTTTITTPRDVTTSGTILAGAKTLYFLAVSGSFTLTGNSSSIVFNEGEYLNLEYPGPSGHGQLNYSTTGTLRIIETR